MRISQHCDLAAMPSKYFLIFGHFASRMSAGMVWSGLLFVDTFFMCLNSIGNVWNIFFEMFNSFNVPASIQLNTSSGSFSKFNSLKFAIPPSNSSNFLANVGFLWHAISNAGSLVPLFFSDYYLIIFWREKFFFLLRPILYCEFCSSLPITLGLH